MRKQTTLSELRRARAPQRGRRRGSWNASSRRSRRRDVTRQAVLGLFPEERIAQQLPECSIGGDRNQHPITEQREAERNEFKPAAANWRQHDQIGEGAIAGEEVEQTEEQQGLRKYRIETRGREREPDQIKCPEHRIEQSRQHRAADEEDEAEKAEKTRGAQQMQRPPGMD